MKKIFIAFLLLLSSELVPAQNQSASDHKNMIIDRELSEIGDTTTLFHHIDSILRSGKEDDYLAVFSFYALRASYKDKLKVFLKQGLGKFPNGELAFYAAFHDLESKFDQEASLPAREILVSDFEKRHPGHATSVNYLKERLLLASASQGKLNRVDFYLTGLERGRPVDYQLRGQVALVLSEKYPRQSLVYFNPALDSLEKITMGRIRAAVRDTAKSESTYENLANSYLAPAYYYVEALIKLNRAQEAYTYGKHLYLGIGAEDAAIRRVYIDALIASKSYGEALPLLENSFVNGDMRDNFTKDLKTAYIGSHHKAYAFSGYMKALTARKRINGLANLKNTSINDPAPGFTLQDVNGASVSLSDLKGKVVILDFWATWCAPCKASFPAMQAAVKKYQNDPDVKFLFIHTFNTSNNETAVKEAKKYITDKKYDFTVLMDPRQADGRTFKVANDYGINGIPNKFVIGPQGNIKFKVMGFNGSNEQTFEELTGMIEFARKN